MALLFTGTSIGGCEFEILEGGYASLLGVPIIKLDVQIHVYDVCLLQCPYKETFLPCL